MPFLLQIVFCLILLAAWAHICMSVHIKRLRTKGIYPQAGKATEDDVRQLLESGRHALAIRCYREIHGCSLHEAKEAVTKLTAKH